MFQAKLANSLKGEGFSLCLPVPNSEGLPPIGSHFYVEWKEINSTDPFGFYLCSALEHHSDGTTTIQYLSDGATERVNLHSVSWSLTRKNSKKFLPLDSTLKQFPLKKIRDEASKPKFVRSRHHKVKAFADDLSLIHSSLSEHQVELLAIDNHCCDLDLKIRPDKCVSLVFDGSTMKPSSLPLSAGFTTPVANKPTKILGQTLGKDVATSRSAASSKLKARFFTALSNIDSQPIRESIDFEALRHPILVLPPCC